MNKAEKLEYWKEWLGRNEAALGDEARKMDEREGELPAGAFLRQRPRKRSGLSGQRRPDGPVYHRGRGGREPPALRGRVCGRGQDAAAHLDYLCVNENRLWGCRGDTIYASKLGDPFNFQVFEGLATDSWQSETLDAGEFTGCVSYLGYPIFFKEEAVYKVYGDKPANYQWTPSARLGVRAGCHRSLAIAGETLYYLSRVGVCAYTGGIPALISDALGANVRWQDAAAGSDGVRYYVSMSDGEAWSLFVYDTRYRTWHREDDAHALGFAFWDGALGMLCADGCLWRLDGSRGTREGEVSWEAEFADFDRFFETSDSYSQNKKGLLRLQLRCALSPGSSLEALVMYDSDGLWHSLGTLEGAAAKKSDNLPMILRRCDHFRLKLRGVGNAVIYSLTEVRYSGSNLQ